MASFNEHIEQVKSNLTFLSTINQHAANYFDWQVTVCFYTALHLVNAHLTRHNLQYRKHHDVNHALNPYVQLSISKLPEDEYEAYMSLQRLSRRSRYLVNEKDNNLNNENAAFTYDKHLCRAVRNLDKLLKYFESKYTLQFLAVSFRCAGLSGSERLQHFTVV